MELCFATSVPTMRREACSRERRSWNRSVPKGGKINYLESTKGSSPRRKRSEGLLAVLQKHPEITSPTVALPASRKTRQKAS